MKELEKEQLSADRCAYVFGEHRMLSNLLQAQNGIYILFPGRNEPLPTRKTQKC